MRPFRHIDMSIYRHAAVLTIVAIILTVASACTSRYRLEMFTINEGHRSKIKIEKTEYFMGVVLGDPSSTDKMVRGDANCLVLITGARGANMGSRPEDIVSFDRYERFRLFLQLPLTPGPDSITLKSNSFVQQLGRYEVGNEGRMYFPIDGRLVIDSIVKNKLFGTVDGNYENALHDTLSFQGQFKAKVAN